MVIFPFPGEGKTSFPVSCNIKHVDVEWKTKLISMWNYRIIYYYHIQKCELHNWTNRKGENNIKQLYSDLLITCIIQVHVDSCTHGCTHVNAFWPRKMKQQKWACQIECFEWQIALFIPVRAPKNLRSLQWK